MYEIQTTSGRETLADIEPPFEEGYRFIGWFWDDNWQEPLNRDMFLYANVFGEGIVYARMVRETGIIINQIYGLGSINNDNQAVSNSFIELYNKSDEYVDLNDFYIHASSIGTNWEKTRLNGKVAPRSSYLIILSQVTNNDARVKLFTYDFVWQKVVFSDKSLKVALTFEDTNITVNNPFDTGGKGTQLNSYVDMIGTSGINSGDSIDGYESAYLKGQSKQKSIRRIEFIDTNNNLLDTEIIDFGTADLSYAPRSMSDGSWLNISDPRENQQLPILPQIHINTNNVPILNKEDYVSSVISINNTTSNMFDVVPQGAGIRLRGNNTMGFPKKPYRIHFDQRISLFGRTANRSWTLLANFLDSSHVKNFGALSLANEINSNAFTPMSIHVELYLDNEYQGLYLLSDQIQENSGRLDIVNQTDFALEEMMFFVELDEYAQNEGILGIDYFALSNPFGFETHFLIKYPDEGDGITAQMYEYIKNYINAVNVNLWIPDNFSMIDSLIDIQSFIDYYLVQEFYGQGEINWKSINMYKDQSGKLKMGPIWDFDWAVGGPTHERFNPNQEERYMSDGNWFSALLEQTWFEQMLEDRWLEIRHYFIANITMLSNYRNYIEKAALKDEEKWLTIIENTIQLSEEILDNDVRNFDNAYDFVLGYLIRRFIWLDEQIVTS